MLYSVTYVSAATEPFSSEALNDLLHVCRVNNAAVLVTGLLLYREGSFMQVLEGSEAAVQAIQARIERDPRHRGILTLLKGPVSERSFAAWSMGFRDLGREPDAAFSEFLNSPFTGEEFTSNPTRAQKLLLSFKKHMQR